jgi:spermidine/putrescine transport system ATP-binding protein
MNDLVTIEHLTRRFDAMVALDDVSLAIKAGSYTVLLGPSGSGKTTLLSILGGFLQPSSGRVLIKGEDCTLVPPAKRPTATVFQDYALFPHMTVANNVAFGLRMRGVDFTTRNARALDMLQLVGLANQAHKKPHQLSGGQRQRVALARALIVEPAVLLLDEPLGALDLKLRRQMQDELKAIQKRVGTAFIHVTHDQEEAMALADHVVVMNQGRIEDQGTPEKVYARPASRFSATFMGESTIVDGHAIRPEHIEIVKGKGNLGAAVVSDVVYQGSFKRVLAKAGDTVFIARLAADADVVVGQKVQLSCAKKNMIKLER